MGQKRKQRQSPRDYNEERNIAPITSTIEEATDRPRGGHTEATERPHKGHEGATEEKTGGKQASANIRKIRLSNSDWQRLKIMAENEGSSRGAIIRRLVRQYLRGR